MGDELRRKAERLRRALGSDDDSDDDESDEGEDEGAAAGADASDADASDDEVRRSKRAARAMHGGPDIV